MKITALNLPIVGILCLLIGKVFGVITSTIFNFQTCHLQISFLSFVIGVPIMQISTLVAITPGHWGVLEGGWFVVLKSLGVEGPDISVFLIATRLWMTVFLLILGLINFWIGHYSSKEINK